MNRYQFKPDVSVKFAPRVPSRLRKAVNRICKRNEMPESDVLRYSFEAAVLVVHRGTMRLREPTGNPALDSMITVRTSRAISRIVKEIHARSRSRAASSDLLHADVLRSCFEVILPIAEKRGMAYVMKLRELSLAKRR